MSHAIPAAALLALLLSVFHADARSLPDDAIRRVIHLSLDERFEEAHALADSLLRAEPDRPEPAFYKAAVYWRQSMNDRLGTRFDPMTLQYLAASIDRAEAVIRDQGESAEMYLMLGNAYGVRTGLEMLRREVVKGVLDGYQGREYLFEALDLDADLVDAYFGLGLSDYILSQNPPVLRMVQRLFSLPSGDREGGIAQLEHVVRNGRFSRADARSALAYIDLYYERDRAAALDRITGLLRTYPNSLDYRIRYADALLALVMENGRDDSRALVDSTRSIRAIAADRGLQLIYWRDIKLAFIEGIGRFGLGDYERAGTLLERVAGAKEIDDNWLLGPAEVTLGKIADLAGKRDDARALYRSAERHEDVWGYRKEARLLQVKAYDGTEPESRPPDDEQRYPERP